MNAPIKPTFLPSENDAKVHNHYKKGKLLGKLDAFILAFILVGIIIAISFALGGVKGSYAEVFYDGELIYTFDLSKNTVVTLDGVKGLPIICVKDGAIAITENDCPSQTCVKTGYIGKIGERIVCVPNKLVIVIRGSDESEGYDGVTGGGGN